MAQFGHKAQKGKGTTFIFHHTPLIKTEMYKAQEKIHVPHNGAFFHCYNNAWLEIYPNSHPPVGQ
jgi:hypothetical protein